MQGDLSEAVGDAGLGQRLSSKCHGKSERPESLGALGSAEPAGVYSPNPHIPTGLTGSERDKWLGSRCTCVHPQRLAQAGGLFATLRSGCPRPAVGPYVNKTDRFHGLGPGLRRVGPAEADASESGSRRPILQV